MTSQNYPETNLQTTEVLNKLKAIEIDYVYRFGENFQDFIKALGITRQERLTEGSTIKFYKDAEVTLADPNVAEGDIIPLSKVEFVDPVTKTIDLKKYRKSTPGESIARYGLQQAINLTDQALVKEIQKGIRDELFTFIKTEGAQKSNYKPGTLQGALATAWGQVQAIFEDDSIRTVAFVNPLDVAKELANKNITLENQFGMNYYTTATGTVIFTSTQIEEGTIYATAPENLVVAYIDPTSSEMAQAMGMTTSDQFGYIGMKHFIHNESYTHQTVVVSGMIMFPERLDGVIKIEIGEDLPTAESA